MNHNLMEEFYRDPVLLDRLMDSARRERARAMREALASMLRGLTRLIGRAKTLLRPRVHAHPGRWLERLG